MTNPLIIPMLGVPGVPGPGALNAPADVTPAQSPYQASNTQIVPVDCRTGAVTVKAPVNPTEGMIFGVHDIYGTAPTNVISVAAQGVGVTVADPSWAPGVGSSLYVTTGTVAQAGALQLWRYSATAKQWRPFSGATAAAATTRTIGATYKTVFNVREFGAVGDGTHDDTSAINSAVAAWELAHSGGRAPALYFPAGDYRIASSIVVSGVTGGIIRGDGQYQTTITDDGAGGLAGAEAMLLLQNCYGVTVDGIHFQPAQHVATLAAPAAQGSTSVTIGAPTGGAPAPNMRCAIIKYPFSGGVATGTPSLTFSAAAHTIVRGSGSWIADNFFVGQYVVVSGSASNNGTLGPITAVTASTLTFAAGVVNEGPTSAPTVTSVNVYIAEELTVLSYNAGTGVVTFTAAAGTKYSWSAGDRLCFGPNFGVCSFSHVEVAGPEAERCVFTHCTVGTAGGFTSLRGFGASCYGGPPVQITSAITVGVTLSFTVKDAGQLKIGQQGILYANYYGAAENVTIANINYVTNTVTLSGVTAGSYAIGAFLTARSDAGNDSHVFINCAAINTVLDGFGLIGQNALACQAIGCTVNGGATDACFGARYGGSWIVHGGTFASLAAIGRFGGMQQTAQVFEKVYFEIGGGSWFQSTPETQNLNIVAVSATKKFGVPSGTKTIDLTSSPLLVSMTDCQFLGDAGDLSFVDPLHNGQSVVTLNGCQLQTHNIVANGVAGVEVACNVLQGLPTVAASNGGSWRYVFRTVAGGGASCSDLTVDNNATVSGDLTAGTIHAGSGGSKWSVASTDANHLYLGDAAVPAVNTVALGGAQTILGNNGGVPCQRVIATLQCQAGLEGDTSGVPLRFNAVTAIGVGGGGTIALSTGQCQKPTIPLTGSIPVAGTIIQWPGNLEGTWDVDCSAVTYGGHTLQFQNGSSALIQITSTGLVRVRCTATNGIAVNQ